MADIIFTVENVITGVVTLVTPTDGSVDVNIAAVLTWNSDALANSYDIEIATDAGFTTIIDNSMGITSTSYTSQNLDVYMTYYWRVRGSNSCGSSNWSGVWSFTTEDIVACSDFTTGPFDNFNPVPSACFNNCTTVAPAFEVYQNESYALYNLAGGEEYTFEFCTGYDPATWAAVITIAEFDVVADVAIPGTEFATASGCSLTFTVPATGDYVIVISDPLDCGGATISEDNGEPTLTCTGLVSCCGATFTDIGGADLNYFNDVNYVVTMCPDAANEIIEVDFSEFSIEEDGLFGDCYDYLTIYDGDNTGAPQIGSEFCDFTGSPGVVTATSASGCLTFEFFSDGSVTEAGWVASVSCLVNCPDADMDGICDADDQCPGIDDGLIGMPCDDNDDCTTGDMYDGSCACVGTALPDTDMDGTCDAFDNCPDDPNPGQEDTDMNGIGDACDCATDLLLTAGQTSGFSLFESSNTITSSELITGTAQVEYSAGFSVELTQSFEVTLGAELHAYILGCGLAPKVMSADQKSSK